MRCKVAWLCSHGNWIASENDNFNSQSRTGGGESGEVEMKLLFSIFAIINEISSSLESPKWLQQWFMKLTVKLYTIITNAVISMAELITLCCTTSKASTWLLVYLTAQASRNRTFLRRICLNEWKNVPKVLRKINFAIYMRQQQLYEANKWETLQSYKLLSCVCACNVTTYQWQWASFVIIADSPWNCHNWYLLHLWLSFN